uniref:glutathione peroxidase n=1 Tax=Oncorhynchus kisutch TaxID=8019 RepID=A0A8C7DXC7_ONCKI
MTFIAKTYDLKSTMLEGDSVDSNDDYSQLNLLQSKTNTSDCYAVLDHFVVLGFPCNWFGYQFSMQHLGSPHFNSLRYVQPGDGYQPGFTVFEKRDVNGTNTHPVFVYFNDKLPYPDDDDDPHSLTQDPKFLTWSTISRPDILRNSSLCQKGEPFKQYSKKFETINMEPEIQSLSLTKT